VCGPRYFMPDGVVHGALCGAGDVGLMSRLLDC
jgi:hypothetical protein